MNGWQTDWGWISLGSPYYYFYTHARKHANRHTHILYIIVPEFSLKMSRCLTNDTQPASILLWITLSWFLSLVQLCCIAVPSRCSFQRCNFLYLGGVNICCWFVCWFLSSTFSTLERRVISHQIAHAVFVKTRCTLLLFMRYISSY